MNAFKRVAQNDVIERVACNFHCLQNRHAGRHQRPESAGEARNGNNLNEGADFRELENEAVNHRFGFRIFEKEANEEKSAENDDNGQEPVLAQCVPEIHDEFCQRRHRSALRGNHFFKRGNDKNQKHPHDDERNGKHDAGINHRGFYFFLNFSGFFLEGRKTIKHGIEHAAGFPGTNHIDVKAVKHARILRERVGKRVPALNIFGNRFECRFENRIFFLIGEDLHGAKQRQTRLE